MPWTPVPVRPSGDRERVPGRAGAVRQRRGSRVLERLHCQLAAGCVKEGEWLSYIGVDVVEEAVDRFNARHVDRPRTHAVLGDIRALPLSDGCADVVLCLFVLQDMEGYQADGLQALRKLRGSRAPGPASSWASRFTPCARRTRITSSRKLRPAGIPEKPTHHWHGPQFLAAVRAADRDHAHRWVRPQRAGLRRTLCPGDRRIAARPGGTDGQDRPRAFGAADLHRLR